MNGAAGRRAASVVAGLLFLFGLQAGAASAAGAVTCSGGSVAAGHYSSLTIAGFCTLDAGNVSVSHNLTVAPGAGLLAAFGGSDLIVGQNVSVGAGSILVLGCEPEAFPCFNDNPESPTMSTHDSVGLI